LAVKVLALLPQLSGTVFPLTSITVALVGQFLEWFENMAVSMCLLEGETTDNILI